MLKQGIGCRRVHLLAETSINGNADPQVLVAAETLLEAGALLTGIC